MSAHSTLNDRVDALNNRLDQLLELGQMLLLAVQEAAEAGVPGGLLAQLMGRVLDKFREAQAEYTKPGGR